MALAFSILTPDWLLHVADAPDGAPRTARLTRHGAPALLSWVGPGDLLRALLPEIARRAHADPSDLASWLATECGARLSSETPATALLAGWGVSPEGHRASFRWRASNFESDEDQAGFSTDGAWLVPAYAQPGHQGKARAAASFSVMVSTTEELPDACRRTIDKLPRDLRANVDPSELALRLVGEVRRVHAGADVSIALLRPSGQLEAGLVQPAGVTALAPDGDQAAAALRPA